MKRGKGKKIKNIRDLLNNIMWSPLKQEKRKNYNIIYIDRFQGDCPVSFSMVSKIENRGITTFNGKYIPFHRVKQVKNGDEIIWRKKMD